MLGKLLYIIVVGNVNKKITFLIFNKFSATLYCFIPQLLSDLFRNFSFFKEKFCEDQDE